MAENNDFNIKTHGEACPSWMWISSGEKKFGGGGAEYQNRPKREKKTAKNGRNWKCSTAG